MPATSHEVDRSREPLSPASVARLPEAGCAMSRVEVVRESPSTNSALLEAIQGAPQDWPHLSAYVADHQSAGRGRSGRVWDTPAGVALTVSFVLRPSGIGRGAWGWAPLVVGLALTRALRACGVDAWVKWPNDIVVEAGDDAIAGWERWRKCVGILCEVVPGQDAIIAGIGINVSQDQSELPVPHAASLRTLGASTLDRVTLLHTIATELDVVMRAWEGADDDTSISADVADVCASIGWDVTVDVPNGSPLSGTVHGLSPEGGLVLVTKTGDSRTVLAGDVRVRRT